MIDLLRHSVYFFKKCQLGWSGFISDVSIGEHDGMADFTMLPKIDLDPNVPVLHLSSLQIKPSNWTSENHA